MAILDLKSNLSQWRKPTTVESGEKKKLSESPVKAVYSTSNELKTPTDIKINKIDNSTSIQVPGAKKIDYKLFSINAKRNRGIPAISTLFGDTILNKISQYKEQRVKEIVKTSEFVKITPRGIQHISTIEILKTILKDKISKYKEQFPRNLTKTSLYKNQLPIDIFKLSLYKDQLPAIIDKLSLYKDQLPPLLDKLSLYKDQSPRALLKLSLYKDQRPNILDKLSLYKKLAANGFDNLQSGARGFTLYQTATQYLGINRSGLKYTYTYPKTVKFGRLNNRLSFTGRGLSGFNDLESGAIGFTRYQEVTQYLGVNTIAGTYTYPNTVKSGNILNRSTFYSDSKNEFLLDGKERKFDGDLAANNIIYKRKYNTNITPYTDVNGKLTNLTNALREWSQKRNSPSPLDIEYTKFNLRDNSFNTGLVLFNQPLILTGIQRKDFVKTGFRFWETWKFDDGFIRGGVVTSTQRAIVDVLRIGKWFSSVKGLLFIARQAGLQASAPNTEADPLVGKRAGNGALTLASSLVNTATQHLGLRFRKDGLPIAPRRTYSLALASPSYKNRLEKVYNEIFNYPSLLKNAPGLPILALGGIGGPQSVYGIGTTPIKRYTVSNSWKTISSRGTVVTHVRGGGILGKNDKVKYINPDSNDNYLTRFTGLYDMLYDNSTFKFGYASNKSITNEPFQQYYTLDYDNLKTKAAESSIFSTGVIKNFLLKIDGTPLNDDVANTKWISTKGDFGYGTVIQDYPETSQHIRDKLRVPDYGKRGKNLQNPLDGPFMKVYKRDFGMIDPIWMVNQTTAEAVDDFVKFMFHDLNTNERFRFRAYIENVSEDFSPNWQEVKILGRADSPYIYQGFERSLSISFKAAALSRGDLMLMWDQLERLARTTVPQYQKAAKMKGPLIKFTLGNWFINTPAFIKSLTYTVDNETPWEINLGNSGVYGDPSIDNVGELPMIVSVQLSMQIFGEVRPESTISNTDQISAVKVINEEKAEGKITTHYNQGNLYPLGIEGLRGLRQTTNFGNDTVNHDPKPKKTPKTKKTKIVPKPAPLPKKKPTNPQDVNLPKVKR